MTLFTLDDCQGEEAAGYRLEPVFPCHGSGRNPVRKAARYVRVYLRMLSMAVREKADLVHFQYFRRLGIDAAFMALFRLLGFAVVYTAHNTIPHEPRFYHRSFFRFLYRLCSKVIVTSAYARRQLEGEMGLPAARIEEVPIGYTCEDGEAFLDQGEARRRLHLPPAIPMLISFGAIREYKGIDTLIEAVARVYRRVPMVRVLIGGPADDQALVARHQAEIERLGLAETITYRPTRLEEKELHLLLSASDLVLVPYRRASGQSAVIMMSYLAARPVIATSVGGIPETVIEGLTGFVVPPDDPDRLAEMILRALADPPTLRLMGLAARERLESRYSWPRIARLTQSAYRSVRSSPLPL